MSDTPPAAAPDEGWHPSRIAGRGQLAAGSRQIKCGLPNAECGMTTHGRGHTGGCCTGGRCCLR